MKKLASLVLLSLLIPILSPIGESFHIAKKYSYSSEEQVQDLYFKDISEPTASLGAGVVRPVVLWKQATGNIAFSSAQNMFTMKIPKTFAIGAGNNPLRVSLTADGKTFPLSIDLDGDERPEEFYYTEPVFLGKTSHVSYVIETKTTVQVPTISVVGLDTDAGSLHVAFGTTTAEAAS